MNLYQWHGLINGTQFSIYAVAVTLEDARKVAIGNAPQHVKNRVTEIVSEVQPAIHTVPTSFITRADGQL